MDLLIFNVSHNTSGVSVIFTGIIHTVFIMYSKGVNEIVKYLNDNIEVFNEMAVCHFTCELLRGTRGDLF